MRDSDWSYTNYIRPSMGVSLGQEEPIRPEDRIEIQWESIRIKFHFKAVGSFP